MQYVYGEKDSKISIGNKTGAGKKALSKPISLKKAPQNAADRYMLEKMKEEEARLRGQIPFGWNGYLGWY